VLFSYLLSKLPALKTIDLSETFYNSDRLYGLLNPVLTRISDLKIYYNHEAQEMQTTERVRTVIETTTSIQELALNIGAVIAGPTSTGTAISRPKVLRLEAIGKKHHFIRPNALGWIWDHCGEVTELQLETVALNYFQQLPRYIDTMSSLIKLVLGKPEESPYVPLYPDNLVAALLRAGRGWTTVECGQKVEFGQNSVDAILGHCSSLECLHISRIKPRINMSDILDRCGRLQELNTLKNRTSCNIVIPSVHGKEFQYSDNNDDGDNDQTSRSWSSEGSLRMLSIKISGIG
jgi:hypothetical protein